MFATWTVGLWVLFCKNAWARPNLQSCSSRKVYFLHKIPISVYFGGNWSIIYYILCMAIWNFFRRFGIFYGQLVIFWSFDIFYPFWYFFQQIFSSYLCTFYKVPVPFKCCSCLPLAMNTLNCEFQSKKKTLEITASLTKALVCSTEIPPLRHL
jgi:hypothetical protein